MVNVGAVFREIPKYLLGFSIVAFSVVRVTGVRAQQSPPVHEALQLTGPEVVHLKDTSSVELELVTPTDALPAGLVFASNIGSLSQPETISPRHWRVEFTLPAEKFPQVALITAHDARSDAPVVHHISLIGRPTVAIQSEPRVSVRVTVGSESYGPQTTDARGMTTFELPAPPGISEITTFATDSFGNVKEGKLPLPVANFSHYLPVCISHDSQLFVVAVDDSGQLATSAPFSVDDDTLSWAKPERVAAGVFRVRGQIRQPPAHPMQVPVRVTLNGESRSCLLNVKPPPHALLARLTGRVTPVELPVFVRVGALVGLSSNLARLTGPWAGIRGSLSPSGTLDGLSVELDASYFRAGTDVATDTGSSVSLTTQSFPFLLGVRYGMQFSRWRYSAQLHGGLDLFHAAISGGGTADAAVITTWLVGAQLGAAYRLSEGDVQLELGYSHAPVTTGPAQGNAGGARLTLGYLYSL